MTNDMKGEIEIEAKKWVQAWSPTEDSWVDFELSYKAYIAGYEAAKFHILTEARKKPFDTLVEHGHYRKEQERVINELDLMVICGVKDE